MPSQTPTAEAPKAQQPMELESQTRSSLVTAQPSPEPRPNTDEPQLSLRGGGLHCGFDCCGGACRFSKNCC